MAEDDNPNSLEAGDGEQGAQVEVGGSAKASRSRGNGGRGGIVIPYPPEVKERARIQYMQWQPMAKIANELGLSYETLKSWVRRGNWMHRREGVNDELTREIIKRRAFTFNKIASQSVEVISRAVADLAKSQRPIKLHEAYQLSMIMGQLDKAMRLAGGLPTEVVKHEGEVGLHTIALKTSAEIRKALKADPMVDIEDAVYTQMDLAEKRNRTPGEQALYDLEAETVEQYAADIQAAEKGNDEIK